MKRAAVGSIVADSKGVTTIEVDNSSLCAHILYAHTNKHTAGVLWARNRYVNGVSHLLVALS